MVAFAKKEKRSCFLVVWSLILRFRTGKHEMAWHSDNIATTMNLKNKLVIIYPKKTATSEITWWSVFFPPTKNSPWSALPSLFNLRMDLLRCHSKKRTKVKFGEGKMFIGINWDRTCSFNRLFLLKLSEGIIGSTLFDVWVWQKKKGCHFSAVFCEKFRHKRWWAKKVHNSKGMTLECTCFFWMCPFGGLIKQNCKDGLKL